MNTLTRQQVSINIDMMDMLNAQVKAEQHASSVYLAMASWCDQNGYTRGSKFLYDHALEERGHMLKIFKFINDNGGAAISPMIDAVNHDFTSLKNLFETALELEIEVTRKIHEMVLVCREKKDLNTEIFLNWFVKEQAEEEKTFRDIVEAIDLMDDAPRKMIDEYIPID